MCTLFPANLIKFSSAPHSFLHQNEHPLLRRRCSSLGGRLKKDDQDAEKRRRTDGQTPHSPACEAQTSSRHAFLSGHSDQTTTSQQDTVRGEERRRPVAARAQLFQCHRSVQIPRDNPIYHLCALVPMQVSVCLPSFLIAHNKSHRQGKSP